jgi:hypothetical protein
LSCQDAKLQQQHPARGGNHHHHRVFRPSGRP